jgi:hypothetical protein
MKDVKVIRDNEATYLLPHIVVCLVPLVFDFDRAQTIVRVRAV